MGCSLWGSQLTSQRMTGLFIAATRGAVKGAGIASQNPPSLAVLMLSIMPGRSRTRTSEVPACSTPRSGEQLCSLADLSRNSAW